MSHERQAEDHDAAHLSSLGYRSEFRRDLGRWWFTVNVVELAHGVVARRHERSDATHGDAVAEPVGSGGPGTRPTRGGRP